MDRFTILLGIGLLTSCASTQNVLETDYKSTNNLRLRDAVAYEKKIGSTDKTPNHLIGIGTGIYPNEKHYELATPATFLRAESYFETQVEYYYSKSDSSVRVILYEWNKKDIKTFETKRELKHKFIQFTKQWNKLSKELNETLGLPTLKQIESVKYGNKVTETTSIVSSIGDDTSNESTAWRDDMKWDTKDYHVYLFMFGDKTGYRRIRLAIYGE